MSLITSYKNTAVDDGGAAVGGPKGRKAKAAADEGESSATNMKPGTRIFAKFRDDTVRRAQVIERKPVKNDDGVDMGVWKYYVHYIDLNRRMDTWVAAEDVQYDAEGDAQEKRERAKAEKAAKAGGGHGGHGAGASSSSSGDDGAGKGSKGSSKGSKGGKDGGHGGGHGGHHIVTGDDDITDVDGTILRSKRRADGEMVIENVEPEHEGLTEASLREHEEVTKVKNVNYLELGQHRMETWYFSPLPKEYWPNDVIDTLHFCEFCLKFFKRKSELVHHAGKCGLKHPPGDEIYRGADGVSMWEVDGVKDKHYCQSLCYLAKMFLDHKTLYYDVDVFYFYVMTKADEFGHHIVGYFSKEKYSEVGYNLACILSLPCYQRGGYGRFLIQFSYELSKKEAKVGSPEKPLSDLGLLSYRSYWAWQICKLLRGDVHNHALSVMDITAATSIKQEDVLSTLQHLGLIRYINGSHIIAAVPEIVEKEYQRLNSKPGPVVDPARIHWAPPRDLPPGVKKDKWLISSKFSEARDTPATS